MITLTHAEFKVALKLQGVPKEHFAFKCPKCGTIQSAIDLIESGAGISFSDVERLLGFSCVGRFSETIGCDWSLGGLFKLHDLVVVTLDGRKHPMFEIATSEQAKELMRSRSCIEIESAA